MSFGPYFARIRISWDHGPGFGVALLWWHAGIGWDSRPVTRRAPPPGCTQHVLRLGGAWLSVGTRPVRGGAP